MAYSAGTSDAASPAAWEAFDGLPGPRLAGASGVSSTRVAKPVLTKYRAQATAFLSLSSTSTGWSGAHDSIMPLGPGPAAGPWMMIFIRCFHGFARIRRRRRTGGAGGT